MTEIPDHLLKRAEEAKAKALEEPRADRANTVQGPMERLLTIKEDAHEWAAKFPLGGNEDAKAAFGVYALCEEYDMFMKSAPSDPSGNVSDNATGVSSPNSSSPVPALQTTDLEDNQRCEN